MNLATYITMKEKFVTRTVGDELVMVPLAGNVAQMNTLFTLNETGKWIWENIQEGTTFEDLVAQLTDEFDIDIETARIDLTTFLKKLDQKLQA